MQKFAYPLNLTATKFTHYMVLLYITNDLIYENPIFLKTC